jgi:hypothetical protein
MFLLYKKNLALSFTVWAHISQHYAVFHGRKKIILHYGKKPEIKKLNSS